MERRRGPASRIVGSLALVFLVAACAPIPLEPDAPAGPPPATAPDRPAATEGGAAAPTEAEPMQPSEADEAGLVPPRKRRPVPVIEPKRRVAVMPSYQEVVRSALYATGDTRPEAEDESTQGTRSRTHDVLTAHDLEQIYETRARFDDPSHHGRLYSSKPTATREELESADRRLVAVPEDRARRPALLDLQHEPAPSRSARRRGRADETRRDFDGSCLRSGCHQSYEERPWVHGPVRVGTCEACHLPAEQTTEEHRFVPTRADGRLCTECHEQHEAAPYRHSGYSDADCVRCHDPHGGSNETYLLSLDQGAMCGQCHGTAPGGLKEKQGPIHRPVAEMQCLSCHAAHGSDYAAVTIAPARELCLQCHEDFIEQFPTFLTLHEPVTTDCGACHLPHGGRSHMIRSQSRELCLGCHEQVAESLANDPLLHTAIKETRSCLDCHVAHASYTKSLLKGRVGRTCISCHDKVIQTESGKELQNVEELLLTREFPHAPAREGQCQECHLSHSLENQKLLYVKYPTQLYAVGETATYGLCLKCHDDRLLSEEQTTATRFRDGTRNLHRVHVMKKKSRTCNTCHEVHAANVPSLMREEIRFGPAPWIMQIGFEKNVSGGSCGVNCHQSMTYVNIDPPGDRPSVKYLLREP